MIRNEYLPISFNKITEYKDKQTIDLFVQKLRLEMPVEISERLDKNIENGNFKLDLLKNQDETSSDSPASPATSSTICDDADSPALAKETPDYADNSSCNALEFSGDFIKFFTLSDPSAPSSETLVSSELPFDLSDNIYQPSSSANSIESAANTPLTVYPSMDFGLEGTAQYDNRYGMEQYLFGTANPPFLVDWNPIQLSDISSDGGLVSGPELQPVPYLPTDGEHDGQDMDINQTCCRLC